MLLDLYSVCGQCHVERSLTLGQAVESAEDTDDLRRTLALLPRPNLWLSPPFPTWTDFLGSWEAAQHCTSSEAWKLLPSPQKSSSTAL